jgi:hypothetical protein
VVATLEAAQHSLDKGGIHVVAERVIAPVDILPALRAGIPGSAQATLPCGSRIRLDGLAARR